MEARRSLLHVAGVDQLDLATRNPFLLPSLQKSQHVVAAVAVPVAFSQEELDIRVKQLLECGQVAVLPRLESCMRPLEQLGVHQLLAPWQFERHHACRSERTRATRLTHERIRRLLVPVRAHSTRITAQSE